MIKWNKRNKRKLNINDIKKVIDILPCSWADGYEEDGEPAPQADGKNFIYAISDDSDGYIVMYYQCSADGTILKTGYEDYEGW